MFFPDELSKALLEEDELGVVLRSHLYIEHKLDELLSIMVPFPSFYEEMNLNYANKVKLACAMGLDPDFKPMLLALGTIRNKFSHNLNKKIDDEMVRNLHSVAHKNLRDSLPEFVNQSLSESEAISSFNEAHPRDQFTSLIATLWIVLCGAVNETEGESYV
jgi:hypothetical protein